MRLLLYLYNACVINGLHVAPGLGCERSESRVIGEGIDGLLEMYA